MHQIISNPARVFDFVNAREPLTASAGMQGLGLEHDGVLVGGIVYERINNCNAWTHVALDDMKGRGVPEFMKVLFGYPFVQLKLKRISGYVEASNGKMRALSDRLGCKQEAVLHGAAHDGGDILIYVMHREDCRYV